MTNEARVLKELRLQHGLSMRKAGALLELSDSYIAHIETGRMNVPTGPRLEKLLLIYGGIKEKSFFERVRSFKEKFTVKDQALELVRTLPDQKLITLIAIAKSL